MNDKEPDTTQPEHVIKMIEDTKAGRLDPAEAISTFPRLFQCPVKLIRKKGD